MMDHPDWRAGKRFLTVKRVRVCWRNRNRKRDGRSGQEKGVEIGWRELQVVTATAEPSQWRWLDTDTSRQSLAISQWVKGARIWLVAVCVFQMRSKWLAGKLRRHFVRDWGKAKRFNSPPGFASPIGVYAFWKVWTNRLMDWQGKREASE